MFSHLIQLTFNLVQDKVAMEASQASVVTVIVQRSELISIDLD